MLCTQLSGNAGLEQPSWLDLESANDQPVDPIPDVVVILAVDADQPVDTSAKLSADIEGGGRWRRSASTSTLAGSFASARISADASRTVTPLPLFGGFVIFASNSPEFIGRVAQLERAECSRDRIVGPGRIVISSPRSSITTFDVPVCGELAGTWIWPPCEILVNLMR